MAMHVGQAPISLLFALRTVFAFLFWAFGTWLFGFTHDAASPTTPTSINDRQDSVLALDGRITMMEMLKLFLKYYTDEGRLGSGG